MSKSGKPPAQPAIGDNSKSALAGLVEDWHRLDRDDLFARGELLIKAHDIAEQGAWEKTCEDEFGISHDTARNLMAVAKVAARHENFRGLRVRKSTLYALAGIDTDIPRLKPSEPDHDALPVIIEALAKAGRAAGKTLSIDDAEDVIYSASLRKKFGADLPDATLIALDDFYGNEDPRADDPDWIKATAEELKQKKPETEADADAIVNAHHRAHIAEIYKVDVAALPAWLDEQMLGDMEEVAAKYRKRLLKKLQGAPETEAPNWISDVIREFEQAEEEGEPESTTNDKGGGATTSKKGEGGATTSSKKGEDGATTTSKKGEDGATKKKGADAVEVLKAKVAGLESTLRGREREIKHLKAKLEAAPTGKADKLAAELVKSLNKGSGEAKELAVEQIVNGLGLSGLAPCKAIVVAALKTVDPKVAQATLAKMAREIGIIDKKKAA
jgi:hypothetical protein